MMDELRDFFTWTRSLETGIAFLLILPMLVAIAGLVTEWRERRQPRDTPQRIHDVLTRSTRPFPDSRPRASGASVNVPRP